MLVRHGSSHHICPSCDYLLRRLDNQRDVCPSCGEIVPDEDRIVLHLIAVFDVEPRTGVLNFAG